MQKIGLVVTVLILAIFSFLYFDWASFSYNKLASADATVESVAPPLIVSAAETAIPNGYLARIQLNDPSEVEEILLRAQALYAEPEARPNQPLELVLHGPEVAIFIRENYDQYAQIVDLAEALTQKGVVDVTVCETRLGVEGFSPSQVQPFVQTVPFGPAEVRRLINDEGYVYF